MVIYVHSLKKPLTASSLLITLPSYIHGNNMSEECFFLGKTGECLYIELFTWKMPHLYLFLCKKKEKGLRFGNCCLYIYP